MAQPHEYLTYQLYQEYHKRVYSTRDVQTYMHFGAVSRTNAASQTELLTGYMKAMIEGIINDMNRFGDCWLLQAILGRELPAVHVLDYSALVYVHTSVFAPEEKPRLNTRSIPYTSEFSGSAGGLLYADPKAPSCTVDIREERLLHHQCRALQLYAQKRALLTRIEAFDAERNALNSQITGLNDRIFGLEHELAEARAALQDTASAVFAAERQKLLDAAQAQAQQLLDSAMGEASITAQQHLTQELESSANALHDAKAAMIREVDGMKSAVEKQLDGFIRVFDQLRHELAQSAADAAEQTAHARQALAGVLASKDADS